MGCFDPFVAIGPDVVLPEAVYNHNDDIHDNCSFEVSVIMKAGKRS
jgi:hypothetical protein